MTITTAALGHLHEHHGHAEATPSFPSSSSWLPPRGSQNRVCPAPCARSGSGPLPTHPAPTPSALVPAADGPHVPRTGPSMRPAASPVQSSPAPTSAPALVSPAPTFLGNLCDTLTTAQTQGGAACTPTGAGPPTTVDRPRARNAEGAHVLGAFTDEESASEQLIGPNGPPE